MTIYWDPVEDEVDPDTIDVWHVASDGTTTGPVSIDVSGVSGMPDAIGGVAPDGVRERLVTFIRNDMSGGLSALGIEIILDMLALDYERGSP